VDEPKNAAEDNIRLVHVSDIHVTGPLGWRARDWFSKRLTGWLNWRVRGNLFRHGERILAAFQAHLRRHPPDCLIFSGDASRLGFTGELARSAEFLGVGADLPYAGVAVPGNHDHYTRSCVASGDFERVFRLWQTGVRVDDAVYPFARRIGHAWLIGVNSCTSNRWPQDASGAVGAGQLGRLERLLSMLDPGPRILVTHYPVALADGRPEMRWHGLRDLEDLLAVAKKGSVCLWLHGHRHHPYELLDFSGAPFPILCVGSLTQLGCAAFNEYTLREHHVRVVQYRFDETRESFEEQKAFELRLRVG
jgi:3',5'-cyclic AMP phosphodiesterase CpdA